MKIFTEEQNIFQPLVYLGISVAYVVMGVAYYNSWKSIINQSFNEMLVALLGVFVLVLVSVLLAIIKLKTRIDEKGISFQFFPFHLKYKHIGWEQIEKCYVRNYDAIFEYGGWGMKFNFKKWSSKSYTTKGNVGIQLVLKNGKLILIGTQLKEQAQQVLVTYNNKITPNEV